MSIYKNYNTQEVSKEHALINETVYYINKSKSKYISIGFSLDRKYQPVLKLGGYKNNQNVVFNKDQWIWFYNNQGIMQSFI